MSLTNIQNAVYFWFLTFFLFTEQYFIINRIENQTSIIQFNFKHKIQVQNKFLFD